MTTLDWLLTALISGISLVSPMFIVPLLARAKVLDLPSARSSHLAPAIRGVGAAPLLALAVGLTCELWLKSGSHETASLATILGGSCVIAAVGLLEDIWGVPIRLRAAAQLIVGITATAFLVSASGSSWWLVPVGGIFFAAYVNTANFMDGIDSISALHGVSVGLTFAAVGVSTAHWLVPVGVAVAAAFAAFMPWNLGKSRMFLGDVGSYLLGGVVSLVAIAAVLNGVSVLAALSPMAIYIADAGLTLVKRVIAGERWYEPHRKHVYQRLADSGLTHVQVGLLVTAFTGANGILGVLSVRASGVEQIAILAGIVVVTLTYLSLPRIRAALAQNKVSDAPAMHDPASAKPDPTRHPPLCTWAVVGGTGFIGNAIVAEVGGRTSVKTVRAPRLEISPDASVSAVYETALSNEAIIQSLAHAFRGVEVVVNAAGLASPGASASATLFGANALAPSVVLRAAQLAGATRFVHLSSAAVQGSRKILDESPATAPFSPYSQSKALGEASLLSFLERDQTPKLPDIVIVRATSVQGYGRATTMQLQRLARSPLASVASPGHAPSVVSSLRGLAEFVTNVGYFPGPMPTIVLQPWEGMTTSSVLETAGGRIPRVLPASLCRILIRAGQVAAVVVPTLGGLVRRVELMWFGQAQNASWARSVGLESNSFVSEEFAQSKAGHRIHD